jgi:hypothetical protein
MIPPLRNHLSPAWSDHGPGIVLPQLPGTHNVPHLASLPTLRQHSRDVLLAPPSGGAAVALPTGARLAPCGTPPVPPGLLRGRCWRGGLAGLCHWCGHDRGRRAAFATAPGYTQTTQPWPRLARERRKPPLAARGRLACCGPDALSTTPDDHIVGVQHRRAPQEPWPVTPGQTRMEEAVDRAVTAALARPARQTSHGHPTAHREHRLAHPTQWAQRGRLSALAAILILKINRYRLAVGDQDLGS